ncbi:DotU family type IV/VI secretion system protein [Pseudomonas gingeri]|uniref:DotU family type IV/VI secretion system protein n=1 Tax=Pseudomonas gingeri TaxID=117681 RepID=A0A7Y8C1N2_9PSED|nr:type IVB secretion system protein IcmH/DotU [Pseudomonas gingeri]NWB95431.1 DotU family type IV/VI secretion system protein [Pseudomonas gingeri]
MEFARTAFGSRQDARASERVQAGPAEADENLCALADDLLHEVVVFQRLRRQPDLPALRLRLIARVRTFQQQALACGIESRIVLRARYALCTLLDEIIASSEWARGAWSRHSLLMTFHQEAEGGEGFFANLDAAQLKPVEHLALLELMYLCLALGLEGRYRIQREGRSILALKRAQLYETLRLHRERYPRPSLKTALPGRWPRHALRWTLGGLLVLLIGLAALGAYDLQVRSAQQWLGLSRLSSAGVAHPFVPATLPTLAERLAEDIQAGRLTLHDEAGAVRLLLGATQLFAPGGSVIAPESRATLQRIATVLADWPGAIRIIGHSDDTPVGKGLVSNQQLSLRRARAVLFEMFGEAANLGRVQVLGRGASEPRVPNDSADNRARNRRVEIVLEPL